MMNKFGFALGVATVATLTGCLDPDWAAKHPRNTGTPVPPAPRHTVEVPADQDDILVVTPVDVPVKHEVVVVDEPATPPPAIVTLPPPAPAEETTTYIVQRGDTLSKISKRFNIKIDAIKAKNPQLKGDVIRLGQKLTLPGAVDVGEQKVPEGAFAAAAKPAVKEYKPYAGATKEYTVKPGDTLGGIAHKNGVTVRQLKELNGLEKDMIRVNQKLVVPAAPVAKTEPAAPAAKKADSAPAAKSAAEAKSVEPKEEKPVADEPAAVAPDAVEEPAPAAQTNEPQEDYFVYTVKDGEDITGISINYDVSPSEIRQLNNLADDAQLTGGMELKLPLSAQH